MNKRKVIGIDLGAYALKVIQFRVPKKGRAVLEKSACFPWVPRDKKRNGTPKELKSHLHACTISRGVACSSLDDPSLLIRRMSLPGMPAKDMQDVLKFMVRKEMDGRPDDIVVDFLPLDNAEPQSRELHDLMVFAVSRKALDAHLRFLEGAGIKPVCVEPPSTGLSHLFESCPGLDREGVVLLLDVGFSRTGLALVENRRPAFIREIPFSGKQLTDSIQEALDVDGKTAEAWKRRIGLEEPEEDANLLGNEVPDILRPLVEDFITEIRYSLGYVQDQLVNAPSVQKIILAGGGAGMPGLARTLEETLQLPCHPLPDFSALGLNVSDDFKSYGQPTTPSDLGTALGLALREVRG